MYPYAVLAVLCLAVPGFGKLPPPAKVTLDSVNFKNILRWNPPPGFEESNNVLYTVQYRLDVTSQRPFSDVCVTPHLECDLTLITYKFFVRVSAAVGDSRSGWVTIQFDPCAETVIGPPEVLVSNRAGYLDLSLAGPFISSDRTEGSIKNRYGELDYRVLYWKEDDPAHLLNVSTSQHAVTLTQLEPWTRYCLQVKAVMPESEKEGEFSREVCKTTSDHGRVPWWQIAVVFLMMMLVAMSVILGLYYFGFTTYRKCLSFPSYSIPEHLKEYLSNPFYNSPNLPIQPKEECGESCDQLTFVSEESEETSEETDNAA